MLDVVLSALCRVMTDLGYFRNLVIEARSSKAARSEQGLDKMSRAYFLYLRFSKTLRNLWADQCIIFLLILDGMYPEL
jgi:hypothetical protein